MFLAEHGISSVIIEREQFPRYHNGGALLHLRKLASATEAGSAANNYQSKSAQPNIQGLAAIQALSVSVGLAAG
jgi:hypothetical protein